MNKLPQYGIKYSYILNNLLKFTCTILPKNSYNGL